MSSDSRILEAVELLLQMYRKPAIMLHRPYPPVDLPPMRSRLGGLPQLPDAFEWPIGRTWGDKADVPLHFLAQIDCAELPSVDSRMSIEGMLFFFGRDNYDQVWDNGEPHDWMRVIYAPRVPEDQVPRRPPSNLPPIGGDHRDFDGLYRHVGPWLLPEEPAPSVHAAWPLMPLRIDSWPDFSAIYETPLCHTLIARNMGSKSLVRGWIVDLLNRYRVFERLKRRRPMVLDALPEWHQSRAKLGEMYGRRLRAARVDAVVTATGLQTPARAETSPGWGASVGQQFIWPTDGRDNPKPFPQAGIMIDRIARMIVRETVFRLRHESYQKEAKQAALKEIQATGRRWVVRAAEVGFDEPPSATDAAGFMAWLEEVEQNTNVPAGLRDKFTKGILSSITYAAGAPRVASLIPPNFYGDLENEHLPFSWDTDGSFNWSLSTKHHQTLGHAPSSQEAAPYEREGSAPVLLLQLCTDYGVNMMFGDAGEASFWIKPADLVARRFDKAWAQIVGH